MSVANDALDDISVGGGVAEKEKSFLVAQDEIPSHGSHQSKLTYTPC